MTPKEQAEILVDKYYSWYNDYYYFNHNHAKEATLICVNEIIECLSDEVSITYWKDVKEEIKKL